MLITSLLPLLSRYSLGFDLAGSGETVTLTIIPRKVAGAKHDPKGDEVRPISITATAAEIDAELARGEEGALGQLIVQRKSLADQIAEQLAAAEAAKTKAAPKTKSEPAKTAAAAAPAATPSTPAPAAEPNEPASLWG